MDNTSERTRSIECVCATHVEHDVTGMSMMRNKRTNIGKTREPLRKMEMITTECCYIQLGAKVHNSKSDNLFIMISLRFRSNRNLFFFSFRENLEIMFNSHLI